MGTDQINQNCSSSGILMVDWCTCKCGNIALFVKYNVSPLIANASNHSPRSRYIISKFIIFIKGFSLTSTI